MSDELLDRLVQTVRDHYGVPNARPLLLSSFGHANAGLLEELKAAFGTLKAAIKAAGEDRLRIVDHTVGRESVAPAEIAAEVERRIREDTATRKESVSNFDSLPRSVRLAFCVRTEADEHIAIELTPPFQFSKIQAPDLLRPGQRLIPEPYRKPGLSLQRASVQEREALWRSLLAWAQEYGVDLAVFKRQSQSNALSRLIAAQRPDVVEKLVIPADIAALLLQHP
jgi:hypothetical protein